MSVCFGREGHNLTHSHYRRYSGNFEFHEPETYLFLCAQCPSSWCFLDIPPPHWMPFEQLPQTWKFTSCQSTPRHDPGPGNTTISSMVWYSSSLLLVAYNGLGGPVILPSYYLSTPLTVSFHQNICWVLDQVPWCPSTLLSYDTLIFPQWNLLIIFVSENRPVSLSCFWNIFKQSRACFFIVLSGLSHLQLLLLC